MGKRLDCRDIGRDCDYVACTATEEETLMKVGEHIRAFHGMQGFSKEFYQKVRASLYEGACDLPKDCSGGICRL